MSIVCHYQMSHFFIWPKLTLVSFLILYWLSTFSCQALMHKSLIIINHWKSSLSLKERQSSFLCQRTCSGTEWTACKVKRGGARPNIDAAWHNVPVWKCGSEIQYAIVTQCASVTVCQCNTVAQCGSVAQCAWHNVAHPSNYAICGFATTA